MKHGSTPGPHPARLAELQSLLDTFLDRYNTTDRTGRCPTTRTPTMTYNARPKAAPTRQPDCTTASDTTASTTPAS